MLSYNSKERTKPKAIKAIKIGRKIFTTPRFAAEAWAEFASSRFHTRNGGKYPQSCCIMKDRVYTVYDQNGPRQVTMAHRIGCNVYNRLLRRAKKIFKGYFNS